MTTFCNLETHSVFDVVPERSEAELQHFLKSLQGRNRVKMVCMDMHAPYRKMANKWFPRAKIVTDRFHVIKLINHHFSKTCKFIDEENLAWGRGGLLRIMCTKRDKLTAQKTERLERYFWQQPAIKNIWIFCQDLAELCRNKGKNPATCRELIRDLIEKIGLLQDSHFKSMKTHGKSLATWLNPTLPVCSAISRAMASSKAFIEK